MRKGVKSGKVEKSQCLVPHFLKSVKSGKGVKSGKVEKWKSGKVAMFGSTFSKGGKGGWN
jgi:hypothetical protein